MKLGGTDEHERVERAAVDSRTLVATRASFGVRN
jgi:hypothetical protein